VRRVAAELARRLGERGRGQRAAAGSLGVPRATLGGWIKREGLEAEPRGRPAERCKPDERATVLSFVAAVGPGGGVPRFFAAFPKIARRELEHLVRLHRRWYRRRNPVTICELRWLRPGAVWAIDHTKAPCPVDGGGRSILAVHDLASHCELVAEPVPDERAETTASTLAPVLAEHGPPLVLKEDNAFRAAPMALLLERSAVVPLVSPPHCPTFNGAREAKMRPLKRDAAHAALLAGHPDAWTRADLEVARDLANATLRPWGPRGPPPAQVWRDRTPITDDERAKFRSRTAAIVIEIRAARGPDVGDATVRREAIGRALVEYGILEVRRRSIRLPVRVLMRLRIS
jgi:hypothetical protein